MLLSIRMRGCLPPRAQGMGNKSQWLSYARCRKRHEGWCLASREGYYSFGESDHMMNDRPNDKGTRREGRQVVSRSRDVEPQKKNTFYVL